MISGHVSGGTADPRRDPFPSTPKEIAMEPQMMEWGPAHLRDEASMPEFESSDRPDDN